MVAHLPVDAPYGEEQAVEHILHVGVRFHPTDEELVGIYLLNEATGGSSVIPGFKIPEFDVYGTEPWLLCPRPNERFSVAGEFYCFSRLQRSTSKDNRLQRQTPNGYWKASTTRRQVPESNTGRPCIGFRMQLKFFWYAVDNFGSGLPRDKKEAKATVWVMNEYRLPASFWETAPPDVGELVMCKISQSGSGLAIGEAWKRPPLALLLNNGAAMGQPRHQCERTEDHDRGSKSDDNDLMLVVVGDNAPKVVNSDWTTPMTEETSGMVEAPRHLYERTEDRGSGSDDNGMMLVVAGDDVPRVVNSDWTTPLMEETSAMVEAPRHQCERTEDRGSESDDNCLMFVVAGDDASRVVNSEDDALRVVNFDWTTLMMEETWATVEARGLAEPLNLYAGDEETDQFIELDLEDILDI